MPQSPDIDPKATSVRLFFAKEAELSSVWHICDAAMGIGMPDKTVMFIALHGHPIYAAVRCDTVLQCDLRRTATEYFCRECLAQFEAAAQEIEKKELLQFT